MTVKNRSINSWTHNSAETCILLTLAKTKNSSNCWKDKYYVRSIGLQSTNCHLKIMVRIYLLNYKQILWTFKIEASSSAHFLTFLLFKSFNFLSIIKNWNILIFRRPKLPLQIELYWVKQYRDHNFYWIYFNKSDVLWIMQCCDARRKYMPT